MQTNGNVHCTCTTSTFVHGSQNLNLCISSFGDGHTLTFKKYDPGQHETMKFIICDFRKCFSRTYKPLFWLLLTDFFFTPWTLTHATLSMNLWLILVCRNLVLRSNWSIYWYVYLCIDRCIYLSIYLSIHASMYRSSYLCIYVSVYRSIYLYIYLCSYLYV